MKSQFYWVLQFFLKFRISKKLCFDNLISGGCGFVDSEFNAVGEYVQHKRGGRRREDIQKHQDSVELKIRFFENFQKM